MNKSFNYKIRVLFLAITAALILVNGCYVSAAPTESYIYDAWDQEVYVPQGYTVSNVIDGNDLSVGKLKNPTDIFVCSDGNLIISDTGNNRLIITDSDYKSARIINTVNIDGKKTELLAPGGLFADDDGFIYVTQKELARVLCMDDTGRVVKIYECPESNLLDDDFEFQPIKIVKSTNDSVFILSDGYFYGAFTYDKDCEFVGFYGCNKVDVTVKLLADYAWKKILSKEQKSKMARYVPISYVSFDIDSDNFIYTCTQTTMDSKEELRKLNSLGDDVINFYNKNLSSTSKNFGDLRTSSLLGNTTDSQFTDVCVGDSGLIYGLDYSRGRVFEYDSEGRLINIFGGNGTSEGIFSSVKAIDNSGNKILVLDGEKGSVTVFTPTEYTNKLHKALALYKDGLYEESKPIWEELICDNVHLEIAYAGLGKALYNEGNYKEAMRMSKAGYDRDGYSLAFKAVREEVIRNVFPIAATLLIIAVFAILIYVFVHLVILKKPFVHTEKPITKIGRIKRSLSHPFDEFYDIKDTNSWSPIAAVIILAVFFAVSVIEKTKTGFIFNYGRAEETNIISVFAGTVLIYLLYVIVNFGVTTLMDGKGTIYQIFVSCTHALIPYIIAVAINTVLSNLLTAEEAVLYTFISAVGLLWSAFVLVGALRSIHDYTFTKTIACIILTALGMLFIIFLLVLFISLVQQLRSFVITVFNELLYRS